MEVARLTTAESKRLKTQFAQSKKKVKINLKNIPARDQCQTPPYALLPLLPYLPKDWTIWESASGEGLLAASIKRMNGNTVIETDLERGVDFFKTEMKLAWDVQVTNPPFSLKYGWLARSYELSKPFALLMPFDTWAAGTAQTLFQRHGICVILLNRRINFKMPNKGWDDSSAQFSTAWFCWGLPDLKQPVTYGHIPLTKELPSWMVRPKNREEIKHAGH